MNEVNVQYKLETKIENNCLQISFQDICNHNEYIGLFSKEFLSEKEEVFKFLQLDAIHGFLMKL